MLVQNPNAAGSRCAQAVPQKIGVDFIRVLLCSEAKGQGLKMGIMNKVKTQIARDPVLSASIILASIGVLAPLVVPPIRNAISRSKPVPPPPLSEVVAGMRAEKRG